MLCGKTPQGTRRDTCFKLKHFLISDSFCYQTFIFYRYCQRVSARAGLGPKNDPGIFVYGSPPYTIWKSTWHTRGYMRMLCNFIFFLKSAAAYKDERTMLKNDMLCHYSGIHLGRHGHSVTIPTFKWKWMSEKNCQKCFMKDTVCSNTQSKTICINLCSDNSIG